MSADIEAIRARLAAYAKYRWWFLRGEDTHEGCECDECRAAHAAHHEYNGHSQEDIAALLAEVERLQRERSEWCDRADVLMTEHMTQMRDLTAEVEALRARLTTVPDMRWWHETPYPEDIWTMTTEQYVAAVPDPQLRTAISGYLMRAGWKVAAQTIKEALEEYALLAAGMEEEQ